MKKTRTTAIILCITTLFALFTGGVYAEEGVTYIDETTLVIENGKVISGDKSLVDKGFVVIGDEIDDGTGEDTRPQEITPDNTSVDFTEDYSAAEEENTLAQSEKAPVKDNTDLIKPDIAPEQALTPSAPENSLPPQTILPGETPNAVNPGVPGQSAKDQIIIADCFGYYDSTVNGRLYFGEYKNTAGTSNMLVYTTQKPVNSAGTRTSYTFYVRRTGTYASVASGRFYRGNGSYTKEGVNYTTNFKGDMFEVPAGKTFAFEGESGYRIYIDGRRVNYNQGSGANINNLITSGTNFNSGKNTGRLLDVYGTCTLNYVTLQNNSTTCNGAGIVVRDGGVVTLNNCVIDNCDSDGTGGGIYVAKGGTITLNTVTIQNCDANQGGAIYVAGAATITLKGTVKIGGTGADNANKADYGANVYLNGGTFTLPSGSYINDGVAAAHGGGVYINAGTFNLSGGRIGYNHADHGGGVFVNGGTFKMTSGEIRNNKADHDSSSTGGGIRSTNIMNDGVPTYSGNINISGGSIFNNTSIANGGGMWIGTIKSFKLTGGSIYSNSSESRGGGMFFNRPTETPIEITGDTGVVNIYSNTATLSGGGIFFGNFEGPISAVIGSSTTPVVNRVSIYSNTVTGGSVEDDKTTGVINDGIGGGIHLMDDEAGAITLTIRHADIYNNTATFYGGGIFIDGEASLTMTDGLIGSTSLTNANEADYGGGIAMVTGASFTMNGGEISYNKVDQHGGAIYSVGQTTINIRGGTISYNEAAANGGALYAAGTNENGIRIVGEVYGIHIHHNKAKDSGTGGGGGLCFSNQTKTTDGAENPVTGVVIGGGSKAVNIYSNEALYGGGVRTLNSGYGLISIEIKNNVNIYSNTATAGETATYKGGGGIFVGGNSELVIDGADIYQNISTFYGAGMVIAGGDVTFKSGNIRNHTVTHSGAGIEMMIRGSFTMEGGYIKGNSAADGGGIHLADDCTVTVSGGEISGNTASGNGGGIAQGGGEVTVSGTTIKDNTAHNGGGIYTNGGSITVSGGSITSNDATYGGGIHIDDNTDKTKTVVFSGGLINENTAVYNGAGVWVGEFASFTMRNITIDNNHAGRIGGGLFFNRGNAEGSLLIESGTVSNNYTDDPTKAPNGKQFLGGGIFFGNGEDATRPCYAVMGGGAAPLNIFGNSSPRGGGICVDDGGGQTVTVVLNSGVSIYDNTATDTIESGMGGGGIYISPSGHVTMNEGVIIGGTSLENGNEAKYGAGVQINGGTFIQNGGSIQYNTATYYAGGVHVIDTTFVMNGGTNKGNYAFDGMGGGVYVATDGAFELKAGAVFTENKANYGGGVYVRGILNMTGGSIGNVDTDSNIATYGGGVCVDELGVFNMSGGAIKNNVYTEGATFNMKYGGGVSVFGTFNMTGGEITGNQATGSGGGVIIDEHNDTDTPTASFVMTGGSITNNSNSATTDSGNGGGIWVGTCVTFKIEGNGTNNPVISGNTTSATKANSNGAGIFINRSVTNEIIIKNCTISNNICNGSASKGGGICFSNTGLVSNNTVSIENVLVTGNKAAIGGGISINGNSGYTPTVSVTMKELTVDENEATVGTNESYGGGVNVSGSKAKVSLSDSAITDNTTNGYGGGIYLFEAKGIAGDAVSFSNVEVNGNTATGTDSFGGGICADSVVLNLTGNNEINENTANAWGGGLIVRVADGVGVAEVNINMTDAGTTTINNNTVGKYGGGVHVANVGTSRFNMKGGEICGNTSNNAYGGGLDTQGVTTLNGTTISDNQAIDNGISSLGGGIIARGDTSNLTLTNCTVNRNTAQYGGGITISEEANATITGCVISENTADEAGGILVYNNSSATASGLTVSDNSTTGGDGGGVLVAVQSSLTMTNSYVINNTANGNYTGTTAKVEEHTLVGAGGGVAVFDGSSFTLTSGGIYGNLASTAGDDVFANGNDTTLDLPSAQAMDLTYTEVKDGLWMEDYLNGDTNSVQYGLNGNSRVIMRYRESPATVRAFASNLFRV